MTDPERHELDGILVGGPSPTKDEFLDGDYLHHELQEKVVGKFDVSYTDESGLSDLVDAAQDVLAETEVMKDKAQMAEFFEQLHDGGKATYGFDATRQNLRMGADDRVVDLPAICISHRKEGALRALYPRWSDGTHHSIEDCTRALCAGDDIENLRPS